MSLSVIPLTILGQITGVSGSGDTVLYQVSFKSIDGTPLYGVTAVWTDEQAEIEALAAQKPYGVWINPIDGTFTVKFAGYTYVGSADLTDSNVLAGVTPIEFVNQSGGGSGLPEVTDADNGKVLAVVNGAWDKSDVEENFKSTVETVLVDNGLISAPETLFDGTITITSEDTQGVEIPFDTDVSGYPFEKWTVTINGLEIPYQANFGAFQLVDDNIGYGVFHNDGAYTLQVANIQDENYPPVPGNYQVKITGVSASGTNLPPIDTSTSYGNYYINVNRVGEIAYQEVQLSRIAPSSANKIYIPACVGGVVDYLNDINGIDVSIMNSPCAYMLTYSASASPSWQLRSINVPTTAGNYVLKATVASGGAVSFSFVSE